VVIMPGGSVVYGTTDPGGVVGGEYALDQGLSGFPGYYGVASAGYICGTCNFPGSNLQGPVSVDGIQYAIVSLSDDPTTGNAPMTGANALIRGGVGINVNLGPGWTEGQINALIAGTHNVWFQTGTSMGDRGFSGGQVPEPSTISLLGIGLVLFGGLRKRIVKSSQRT
jgi:hypothetical protein